MASRRRVTTKVVVLGDSGVGKTCLLKRYVLNTYSATYKATIGADFLTKELIVGDRHVGLQIWDTAGQERFHCLAVSFYRGADASLLVFDVTDRDSFDHLTKWKQDMLTHTNAIDHSKFPFIVLGTKIDLGEEQRRVSRDEAEAFAKGLGVSYYEVSALSGENVDAAFLEIAIKTKEAFDQQEMVFNSERINDDAVVDLEGESDDDGDGKKGCC